MKKLLIIALIALIVSSCSNEKKEFEKCCEFQSKQPRIDTAYKQLTFGMSMDQYEAAKEYYTPMDVIDFGDSKAIGEPMNVQFGEHDSLDLIRVRYNSDNEYIVGSALALHLQGYFMEKYNGTCYYEEKKANKEEYINLRKSNMDILIESEKKYCFVTFRNLK